MKNWAEYASLDPYYWTFITTTNNLDNVRTTVLIDNDTGYVASLAETMDNINAYDFEDEYLFSTLSHLQEDIRQQCLTKGNDPFKLYP